MHPIIKKRTKTPPIDKPWETGTIPKPRHTHPLVFTDHVASSIQQPPRPHSKENDTLMTSIHPQTLPVVRHHVLRFNPPPPHALTTPLTHTQRPNTADWPTNPLTTLMYHRLSSARLSYPNLVRGRGCHSWQAGKGCDKSPRHHPLVTITIYGFIWNNHERSSEKASEFAE
jgi:hypothetical protein